MTVPAAPQYSYIDYWGTDVVAFNVDRNHDPLIITGYPLVDTQPGRRAEDCTWPDVADASIDHGRSPFPQPLHRPGPELAQLAARLRADPPLETARRHRRLPPTVRCDYVRGITPVHTSANEAFADGAGVCQDFAPSVLVDGASDRPAASPRLGLLPSRSRTPSSARRSLPRATPGSSSGPALGGVTTPPTTVRWVEPCRGRPWAGLRATCPP